MWLKLELSCTLENILPQLSEPTMRGSYLSEPNGNELWQSHRNWCYHNTLVCIYGFKVCHGGYVILENHPLHSPKAILNAITIFIILCVMWDFLLFWINPLLLTPAWLEPVLPSNFESLPISTTSGEINPFLCISRRFLRTGDLLHGRPIEVSV